MEHGLQIIIRQGHLGVPANAQLKVQVKDICKTRLYSHPDQYHHNLANLLQRLLKGRRLA